MSRFVSVLTIVLVSASGCATAPPKPEAPKFEMPAPSLGGVELPAIGAEQPDLLLVRFVTPGEGKSGVMEGLRPVLHGGEVKARLVLVPVPPPQTAPGELPAARLLVAAHALGKFWEALDAMTTRPASVEAFAQAIGVEESAVNRELDRNASVGYPVRAKRLMQLSFATEGTTFVNGLSVDKPKDVDAAARVEAAETRGDGGGPKVALSRFEKQEPVVYRALFAGQALPESLPPASTAGAGVFRVPVEVKKGGYAGELAVEALLKRVDKGESRLRVAIGFIGAPPAGFEMTLYDAAGKAVGTIGDDVWGGARPAPAPDEPVRKGQLTMTRPVPGEAVRAVFVGPGS